MRSPRIAALVAVLAIAAAACVQEADDSPLGDDRSQPDTGDTTPPTAGEGPAGFVPGEIEWQGCGSSECGTLEVPLDYEQPDGQMIQLFITRAAARGDRRGALFVNPGGPGASAAEMAAVLPLILPGDIVESFDIVGVDPRGVGGSVPMDCGVASDELYGVDPTIEDDGDRQALLDISEAYVDDCAIRHGDVLPHVGTADVARDMDAVRAAMGDEQLSFLGFSYGSVIGQVYAELFPERVRSMVLDGIVELGPSGIDLAAEQAAGFETALSRYVEYCDAAEGCETAGNALGAVEEVLALAEEPGGIPAPDADRPLGPGEANLGVTYALYSQSLWNRLDSAIAEALGGDGSALVDLADGYLGMGGFSVYFAVNCLDFAWPGDPDVFLSAAKDAAQESPHFGEALVNDYIRCADWPVTAEPLEPVTAAGAPPIVVISTTGDPATPYEAGVAVAERLESGVLVTNEGDGHTVVADGKDCIDDLVTAYLVEDEVPEDGTTCT